MLETQNWIKRYFDDETDAILIFANNDLIVCNRIANDLQKISQN